LNAATGEILATYDHVSDVDEMVLAPDGTLALRVRDIPVRSAKDGTHDAKKFLNMVMESGPEEIVAMDGETGEVLWRTEARRVAPESLAADDQRVAYYNFAEIVCLDLATGEELWRTPCERIGREKDGLKTIGPRAYSGTVVFYEGNAYFNTQDGVRCLSGKTGEVLWKGGPRANWGFASVASYMIADRLVWAQGGGAGLDPLTGEQVRRPDIGNMMDRGHHTRCYRGKATERYLIAPRRGAEFVDLRGDNHAAPDWLRGACSYGVMPANGLLYAPPDPCSCYPGVKVPGFSVVYGRGRPGAEIEATAIESRLVQGTAEPGTSEAAGPEDWPTYRHDARRSGEAATAVDADPDISWVADLGGQLIPPVIAAGRVFVARKDAHRIVCLAADGGRELWRFTAGGPVDSPPTVHEGLVIFGCADGRVYALNAADGRLAWRFRVAPQDRRLMSYGKLESVWPAHGSVLVMDDVVYATAGRSSYLDGGIHIYGLDAATGKVLHHTLVEGPRPDLEELREGLKTASVQKMEDMLKRAREEGSTEYTVGNSMSGLRSDVLVGAQGKIYLFQKVFDRELRELPASRIDPFGARNMEPHLISNNGFLDASMDERKWWVYSDRWPGWHYGTQGAKQGRLLVFDDEKTYAAQTWPEHSGRFGFYVPGDQSLLVADANTNKARSQGELTGEFKPWTLGPMDRKEPPLWQARVPMIIDALALTRRARGSGKVVFVAGTKDPADPDDLLAPFEGRTGGLLWSVSADDGAKLAEMDLASQPVFDGMAAAAGRLYISMSDGRLLCLGSANSE
jgi:outer membrane protein assembly factor BamB